MSFIDPATTEALRRRLRALWASRGGGYYGIVATLTFLYLEGRALGGGSGVIRGLRTLYLGGFLGFLIGSLVDAVTNAIKAALWPLVWIAELGIGLRLILLIVGSMLVYRLLRPAILHILGAEADDPATLTADTPAE